MLSWQAKRPGERPCAHPLRPTLTLQLRGIAAGQRGQALTQARASENPRSLGMRRGCSAQQGPGVGEEQLGSLVVTFYGTPAHQVGEGKMQGPLRGEIGLCQGPHALAHLQKQLSPLTAHGPSLGQLQAGKGRAGKEGAMEGRPCPSPCPTSIALHPWAWSQQPALSVSPNCSFHWLCDHHPGP